MHTNKKDIDIKIHTKLKDKYIEIHTKQKDEYIQSGKTKNANACKVERQIHANTYKQIH